MDHVAPSPVEAVSKLWGKYSLDIAAAVDGSLVSSHGAENRRATSMESSPASYPSYKDEAEARVSWTVT